MLLQRVLWKLDADKFWNQRPKLCIFVAVETIGGILKCWKIFESMTLYTHNYIAFFAFKGDFIVLAFNSSLLEWFNEYATLHTW